MKDLYKRELITKHFFKYCLETMIDLNNSTKEIHKCTLDFQFKC